MSKDKINIPHIAFEITNECNLKCVCIVTIIGSATTPSLSS